MRRDVSATPHFSTARRDIASMETFQLDSLIAEGAPEVVLLRERRDSESKPDTFVDDIKYLLARERLVNRESEGKDDDSDDGGADAKDGAASAAAAKDADVPEAKGDAVFLESDDDADAKDGAPDTVYLESDDAKDGARDTVFLESDADDDDAKSGASSDAESDAELDAGLFAGGGMSANLLALLGKTKPAPPKATATATAPRRGRGLEAGIFRTQAGTWVPPTTHGLGNSASLLA